MTDLYDAVSFKSAATAHWIESSLADQRGEAPLDFKPKRHLLIRLSEQMLQAYSHYCDNGCDTESLNNEEDPDLLDLALYEIEKGLEVTHPNHFAVLYIPMDLNGMILVVLAPYPERGTVV